MADVIHWLEGAGWLILCGGADSLGEIRAEALSRVRAEGGIAYIGLDDNDLDDLLDDMGELGAPTGYLVNIMTEDDETLYKALSEAAMIVIPSNYRVQDLKSALLGVGIEGIQTAYESGAVILVEGEAVALFGTTWRLESGDLSDGLNWIQDAFLVAGVTSIAESEDALEVLATQDANLAIGIGKGSAIAFGEGVYIETWGQRQVTIAFGKVSNVW